MKRNAFLMTSALTLSLAAGSALAEPENGFSINGGLASHNASGQFTIPPITPLTYNSSGISLGLDYQIAVGPNLSVNPFLQLSSETVHSPYLIPGLNVSHSILGVQLRYWAGDVFFGGHVGYYSESMVDPVLAQANNGNGTVAQGSGMGAGLVAGLEMPQGFYFMGQFDSFTAYYPDATLHENGMRLSVGYRWK